MRFRSLFLRCVALALLTLLPACAAISSRPETSPAPSPAAERLDDPTVLTIWHSWAGSRLSALSSVARRYEQDHPHVRIRLESVPATTLVRKYSTSLADGSAPQLLLTRGRYIGELAAQQYISPLDEALEPATTDGLLPAALDSGRVDGVLYGLPIAFDALVLFYDRRYVVEPPATVEQLIALNSPEGSGAPEQPINLAYHLKLETTLPYLYAFGGSVLSEDGSPIFAGERHEQTIKWLEWLQSLQKRERTVVSTDYSVVDASIQSGRAWSAIDWSYRWSNYAQLWGTDTVGAAPLPDLESGQSPRSLVLSHIMAVNPVASREQRDAALDFLRFAVQPPAQEILASASGVLPSNLEAEAGAEAQVLIAAVDEAQALTSGITDPLTWQPLNDMFRNVLSGATTPSEAVAGASAERSAP